MTTRHYDDRVDMHTRLTVVRQQQNKPGASVSTTYTTYATDTDTSAVKLTVHVDSYKHQSYAKIELFTTIGWTVVATLPQTDAYNYAIVDCEQQLIDLYEALIPDTA